MPARRAATAANTHTAVHHEQGHAHDNHHAGHFSPPKGNLRGPRHDGSHAPTMHGEDDYADGGQYTAATARQFGSKSKSLPLGGGTGLTLSDDEEQFEITRDVHDMHDSDLATQHTEHHHHRNFFKKFLVAGKRQPNPLYGRRLNAAAKICEHPVWEPVCLLIIVLNGIWIGVELDQQDPDATKTSSSVKMAEYAFCIWFTVEIGCRLMAYQHKCSYFTDPDMWKWNVFDLCLVLMLIVENGILPFVVSEENSDLPALSALRLLRLLRIVRVLRMIPELAMMVRSLIQALRTVGMTFILALGIMYVFSIILTQWARDYDQPCKHDNLELCVDRAFGTIPRSFLTLLQILCFDDSMALIRAILDDNVAYGLLLIVYILIAAFTVLNMLIGVVANIVKVASEQERQIIREKQVHHLFSLIEIDDGSEIPDRRRYISVKELEKDKSVLKDELAKVGVTAELIKTAIDIFKKKIEKAKGTSAVLSDGRGGFDKEAFIEIVFKLSKKPETQDLLLIQAKLELLAKAVEEERNEGRIQINVAASKPKEMAALSPPPEEEEQTEEQKLAEEEAMENIARGMTELESQVASMLDQALESSSRPRKLGDTAPWDLELRRLDATMSRLRVRLERCIDEKGPSVVGRKGEADHDSTQLASSEFETWKRLCREVVQSISAASSLMAQAIKEVEPEMEPIPRYRPQAAEI